MEGIKLRGRSSSYCGMSSRERREKQKREKKKEDKENHKEGEREEEAFPPLFLDLGGSRIGPTHFKM